MIERKLANSQHRTSTRKASLCSPMQVFNQYVMPATIETLARMIEQFNAASGNAIRLTTQGFTGDFLQECVLRALHSARRRVDRYASNTTASATDLTELKRSGVKVAGGFGPVLYEPAQLTWLQRPTRQGIEVISRNLAEAIMQDQLNTAILPHSSPRSRTRALPPTTSTSVAVGGYPLLGDQAAPTPRFGDHSAALICDVMTGSVMHKLISQELVPTVCSPPIVASSM